MKVHFKSSSSVQGNWQERNGCNKNLNIFDLNIKITGNSNERISHVQRVTCRTVLNITDYWATEVRTGRPRKRWTDELQTKRSCYRQKYLKHENDNDDDMDGGDGDGNYVKAIYLKNFLGLLPLLKFEIGLHNISIASKQLSSSCVTRT